MKQSDLLFKELKQVVRELGKPFPKFKDDDCFVHWFLRAYVTDGEDCAAQAVAGCANDKGVDALLIDDAARSVHVVQGKYRQKLGASSESTSDVRAFAQLADFLHRWEDEPAQKFLDGTDAIVGDRLRAARRKVQKEKYRTWLYFVSTGKVSATIRKDVQQQVRQAAEKARIEVIDGRRVILIFRDYLDGVAPPIRSLDLEMEAGSGVKVNGVAQRFDQAAGIESWGFSMRGDAIAALYERAGTRLFARNIRGFMGMKTPVNQEMVATLQTEPERFFYYNNGITIVCDEAERKSSQGRDLLVVGNPQVINGQQTTRTLAHFPKLAGRASVLVKVIRVPRESKPGGDSFEELVSRIVQGTNWQNAIRPSDLMSNDRRQIDLERELRKVGYFYLRKRQSKSEARKLVGTKQYYLLTKEQFAQAVAGCDLDPHIIRSGLENLFKEEHYSQVFPNSDPEYYLPRYRLMHEVTFAARGIPQRGYAKWLVLNFMWSHVTPLVRARRNCRAFLRLCEKQVPGLVDPLYWAINDAYVEALKYYRANRGTGDAQVDVSLFFRNPTGHHTKFAQFWKTASAKRREKFDARLEKVKDAIASFED